MVFNGHMADRSTGSTQERLAYAVASLTDVGGALAGQLQTLAREPREHQADSAAMLRRFAVQRLGQMLPGHVVTFGEFGPEGRPDPDDAPAPSSRLDDDAVRIVIDAPGSSLGSPLLPWGSVSLGLVQGHEPIGGVVMSTDRRDVFQGARGIGARHNNQPLDVEDVGAPAVLWAELPPEEEPAALVVARVLPRLAAQIGGGLRILGQPGLGMCHGLWGPYVHPGPTDSAIAASAAIVLAAGGAAVRFDAGWGRRGIVSGTPRTVARWASTIAHVHDEEGRVLAPGALTADQELIALDVLPTTELVIDLTERDPREPQRR